MRVIDLIVKSIDKLGGEAELEDIYEEVNKYRDTPQPSIRARLYEHASECDAYKENNPDLFISSDGKGGGKWRSRSKSSKLEFSNDDVFVQGRNHSKQRSSHNRDRVDWIGEGKTFAEINDLDSPYRNQPEKLSPASHLKYDLRKGYIKYWKNKELSWEEYEIDLTNLKVGDSYSRQDIRDLCYSPTAEGKQENWGGRVNFKNAVLIMVKLDKSDVKEHLKYLDYFEGSNFYWDTAGNTSIDTHGMQKILQRVPTYLFCRLSDKIKGVTQPFVFVGEMSWIDYEEREQDLGFEFECIDYQESPNQALKDLYDWKPGEKVKVQGILDPQREKKHKSSAGYQTNKEKRDATEWRAMNLATEHYESLGYEVEDVHEIKGLGYDLRCTLGSDMLGIEVKGTMQSLGKVSVTRAEVKAAQSEETVVDLFIVYEILCVKDGDEMIGEGGKTKIIENWKAEDNQLTALTYDYEISI